MPNKNERPSRDSRNNASGSRPRIEGSREAREKREDTTYRPTRADREEARITEKERHMAAMARERRLREEQKREQAERRAEKAAQREEKRARREEKKAYRAEHATFYDPDRRLHIVLPICLAIAGFYIGISFILREQAGWLGLFLARFLLGCFSYAAYLIPFFMLIHAALWRRDIRDRMLVKRALAFIPLLLISAVLAEVGDVNFVPGLIDPALAYTNGFLYMGGGFIGNTVGYLLHSTIGMVGIILAAILIYLLFIALYFSNQIAVAAKNAAAYIRNARIARAGQRAHRKAERRAEKERDRAQQNAHADKKGEDSRAARREASAVGRRERFSLPPEEDVLTAERRNTNGSAKSLFNYDASADMPSSDGRPDSKIPFLDDEDATAAPTSAATRDLMDWDEEEDFSGDGLTVTTEEIRPMRPMPQATPIPKEKMSDAPAVTQDNSQTGEENAMDYFRRITVSATVQEPVNTPTMREAAPLASPSRKRSAPADVKEETPASPVIPPVRKIPDPTPPDEMVVLEEDLAVKANAQEEPAVAKAEAPQEEPFTAHSSLRTDLAAARTVIPPSETPAAAPKAAGSAFRPLTEPDDVADEDDGSDAPQKRPYQFPPISLLALPEVSDDSDVQAEVQANAEKLVQTLENFKVHTHVSGYSRGPRITRYEVVPDAGIRVRTISTLVEDISMSLATSGIRIEAPIPGKSAVGVEVPNKAPTIVRLRRLLDTDKFRNFPEKTVVCLGEDVTGQPVYCDLAKMPHMLVAGATGMGKSVCINSIITSLLYKASPDEVKLIMIDPKKVEFGMYSGIPHLLVPVVTDPKKAAGALAWAVNEMERRFGLIERAGVRDIKGYNHYLAEQGEKELLPKIIIIIDELHDLMMSAKDAVETSIARIAAKARAAGIHLLIGTQRPSVDVITGTIKANIPSRVAFHVSSQVDSRTILDFTGAEKLLAHGDMLFAPVGMSKPQRVQGAFVDDKEVDRIVEYIKANNEAETESGEQIMADIEREAEKCSPQKKGDDGFSGGGTNIPTDEDDHHMQWAALEVGFEFGRMSTSLLQRKLSIGYGKAAKILDALEAAGYISAQEGAKPREILISREEFKEMMARGVAEQTGGNFGQ